MNTKFFIPLFISTVMLSGCLFGKKSTSNKPPVEDPYNSVIYLGDSKPDPTANSNTSKNSEKEVLSKQDSLLKLKYAGHMKIPMDSIHTVSLPLYRFIDSWLYTPYLWGGTTRRGIDCSAFVQRLLLEVYGIRIPRTSIQQYLTQNVTTFMGLNKLQEGDLIFFKTLDGNPVTHVGLYLKNGYFINSASQGVTIANLRTAYWASKYVSCGRINTPIINRNNGLSKN